MRCIHHRAVDPYRAERDRRGGRLVLLCRFHHHAVHEGGFTLDRSPTGTISVTGPDGTLLTRAGPGRQVHDAEEPELPLAVASATVSTMRCAPKRPATRFRTLARRRDADQRAAAWWRQATVANAARLGLPLSDHIGGGQPGGGPTGSEPVAV